MVEDESSWHEYEREGNHLMEAEDIKGRILAGSIRYVSKNVSDTNLR